MNIYICYVYTVFVLNNLFVLDNIIIGDILKIRLGYACICNAVNGTSSSPYTYNEYLNKGNLDKLNDVIISNLSVLEKIIDYNIKNNVHFYRMSSKLIPLATKDEIVFDYIDKYKVIYNRIGKKIKDYRIRVDFHPDQYCVLNSTKKDVVENSIKTLEYHYNLLDAFGIKDKILILHVGGNVFGKNNSIRRFINNFKKLPSHLKKVIVVENDDKIFNACDVFTLSELLDIPMVFDYHHHKCNPSKMDIKKILNTWKDRVPKIHYSTSKNSKDFRSHSDYINSDEFIDFIEFIKVYGDDIDIMIEAKCEDDALFRLVRELKYKTNYRFVDDTTFEV